MTIAYTSRFLLKRPRLHVKTGLQNVSDGVKHPMASAK
jgi:hypothetical protein